MLISRLVNNFFIFTNIDLGISILIPIFLVWSPDYSIQVPRYFYVNTFSVVVFVTVKFVWFKSCGSFVTIINFIFPKSIFAKDCGHPRLLGFPGYYGINTLNSLKGGRNSLSEFFWWIVASLVLFWNFCLFNFFHFWWSAKHNILF